MTTGNDALWHPFAAMHDLRRCRTVMTRAEDSWSTTAGGSAT
jgi:adenosylmethionine-8-amino-7-oxononanoate aminotransferase